MHQAFSLFAKPDFQQFLLFSKDTLKVSKALNHEKMQTSTIFPLISIPTLI